MSTRLASGHMELITEHLMALQEYAQRVFDYGELLTPNEENDKALRFQELLVIGSSFGCTNLELVKLVYAGLFKAKRGCDCPTCRARKAGGQMEAS